MLEWTVVPEEVNLEGSLCVWLISEETWGLGLLSSVMALAVSWSTCNAL